MPDYQQDKTFDLSRHLSRNITKRYDTVQFGAGRKKSIYRSRAIVFITQRLECIKSGRFFGLKHIIIMKQILLYALATNWLLLLPAWKRYIAPYGKPFNCSYCLAFWLALIGTVFIPLILGITLRFAYAPFTAPVVAYGIEKYLKSLPTTLTNTK